MTFTGTDLIRHVTEEDLRDTAEDLLDLGMRPALIAAHDDGPNMRVVYLFLATTPVGTGPRRAELHLELAPDKPTAPSLAYVSFPASRFEREMHDLFGIRPVGHPALRPLVRHSHWPDDWFPMSGQPGPIPYFDGADVDSFGGPVEGTGVYEIPVGPVHAGLIEPGHFRFSVVGETVLRLEARLWYVHRGIEKLFEHRPAAGAVELAERVSGDTSVGHSLAHTLAVEDALGITVTPEAARARALLLELERLYNHAGDLGALANDTGFALANAHALRIRERLLRLNRRITGHRLLRGAIQPGGVRLEALPDPAELAAIGADMAEVARLTLSNSLIHDRLAGTSVLTDDQVRELGCLGYVARASGVRTDARIEHPTVGMPVNEIGATTGDVLARYTVRRDEFAASIALSRWLIDTIGIIGLPTTECLRDHGSGVGVVEGWRGTIVHRVEIADGRITRAKMVDPSWFNWPALPVAMADTIVPDFPLTNKSFNLSYAGNDL